MVRSRVTNHEPRRSPIVITASWNFAVEGPSACRALSRTSSAQPSWLAKMHWILLSAAILLEVAGITSMKLSRGFAEPLPSIAVPVFYVLSAAAVILALKRLDLSVTYAIWSGVGTALAAAIGIAYFREPLTLIKVASLALVILGVVGLSLAARQTN